jgi:hypothetical protein
MFRGLNRLLVGAAVAGAVLAAPTAAFACGGGPSAVNVYKECLPTGGGGKSTSGGQGKSSGSTTVYSTKTAAALKRAGKDRRVLAALVAGSGHRRFLQPTTSGATTSPSAVGSAFDLGSGPTALLIALAGTALLLLGGSGLRLWRRSHRA